MSASAVLTAQHLERRRRSSARAGFLFLLPLVVPLALTATAVPFGVLMILAVPTAIVMPWIWRAPVRGVYLLVGCASTIEIFPLHFSDSLTDRIPLFLNLNNTTGVSVSIAPIEVIMVAVLMVWLARGIAANNLSMPRGPIVKPYLIFVAVVLFAEIHGLTSGGDFKLSLWELRPQAYGFVMFFLAGVLIKDLDQLKRVVVVFIAGVSFKAILGAIRVIVTLRGHAGGLEAIMAHEESFFLALLVIACLVSLFWMRSSRLMRPLLIITPVALLVLVENHRRVGLAALEVAIGAVLLLAIRFEPRLRARLSKVVATVAVGYLGFAVAFWNASGIAGQLLRPLHSLLLQTDQRDFLSDIYRVAENANLLFNFRSSPLTGLGFGKHFQVIFPMADISYLYPLWDVIPHNSLLWVGLTMGVAGLVAFWGLVAAAILQATHQMATRQEAFVRAFCAFAVAAVLAELVVAWGDLQLENVRNMMLIGAVIGVLNVLPRLKERV